MGSLLNFDETLTFDGVDEVDEYLDMSRKGLSITAMSELFEDVKQDDAIKHLNVSYNISEEEVRHPGHMTQFIHAIIESIAINRVITAIDISGNCLGLATPHPATGHTMEYIAVLSSALVKSNITHLDISGLSCCGIYAFI